MAKLYKFMHQTHVDSILGGTVLFKDFRLFRDLPPPIGDKMEGIANIEVGDYTFNDRDGADALGGAIMGVPGARVSGITVQVALPPVFISCFAFGELDRLVPRMLHTGDEQYDAVVEITDVQALADDLKFCAMVGKEHYSRYFQPPIHRVVTYGPAWRPPVTSAMTREAIFRKHTDYEHQSEYRFVVQHFRKPPAQSLLFSCTQASGLFRRVI